MPRSHPSENIAALERQILRALCGDGRTPGEWEQLAKSLANYSWQELDHRVIYEALCGIHSYDAETRRIELPAQATRMGFPDVDWDRFFKPAESPEPKIEELLRRLKANVAHWA